MTVLLAGTVFFAICLTGCSSPDQNTAVLWTNQPEFAAYVEAFNAHQNTYRVMLVYKSDPAVDLASANTQPDIVVGEYLRNDRTRKALSSLNGLMGPTRISPALFYPGALKAGSWAGNQMLLPVSFNLPAVMFLRGAIPPDKGSFFVTLTELKELAKKYNQTRDGTLVRVGFSPRWSGSFLYDYALLQGANFHQDGNGKPIWDDANLTRALDSIRTWIKENNDGFAADTAFTDRYLYEPSWVLLENQRVQFTYTDAASFFQMDENKRQQLDFRWIASKERVPVIENMLFAGIPGRARHRRPAEAFLRWYFEEKTQAQLLDESQIKQLTSFGIAGGFSPMPVVNEMELPKHYPQLLGHVPKNFDLLFPPPLPRNWSSIKEQVVKPWLEKMAENPESTVSLTDRIKSWLLQQGD